MDWRADHGRYVADWKRGTLEVTFTRSGHRDIAQYQFKVFEGAKLVDQGWCFTKESAQHAAETP